MKISAAEDLVLGGGLKSEDKSAVTWVVKTETAAAEGMVLGVEVAQENNGHWDREGGDGPRRRPGAGGQGCTRDGRVFGRSWIFSASFFGVRGRVGDHLS